MSDQYGLTWDDYADAVAILRATLANDENALMALFRACNVGSTFQAVVRLHLSSMLSLVNGDPEPVDRMLQTTLAGIVALREDDQ